MKHSKGFTLIELVVVIAILGILAAVALPRFINATKDAHQAAFRGAAGALASAVALVRVQYELNRNGGSQGGACAGAACQINVGGFGAANVDVNTGGWPVGIDGGSAIASVQDCIDLWQNILQGTAPSVAGAVGSDYRATQAGQQCTFSYQLDGADDAIVYDAANGDVTYSFN
ncbi:prepilin-type N-terminal cleavage/methylation domain-containing protein [Pseudomonas sp. sp1636]|uniref:type II secretion system protein n=1 Tax=Pseudomonas sp. sp1636 TaxID=3036707 RepID=UPI0025A62811|nr:prepilin-type N-terminal cleavage/methylation domain-containing protein [Pseudomonas sp. sp1636]MDM8348175.1 prepilin-type N-terminal cleavage/methylation domain-containing protein [Pseudomonas sp. sp1636]